LKTVKRGGHLRTEDVVRKQWQSIKKFFDSEQESARRLASLGGTMPRLKKIPRRAGYLP
jgi:hypothetical protein